MKTSDGAESFKRSFVAAPFVNALHGKAAFHSRDFIIHPALLSLLKAEGEKRSGCLNCSPVQVSDSNGWFESPEGSSVVPSKDPQMSRRLSVLKFSNSNWLRSLTSTGVRSKLCVLILLL